MEKIRYFIFSLLILVSIFSFACTKNLTNTETFIISGVVTLEGETDYSDITVALYAPAELDTAIVNMHKRFPSVGFELTQAAVFDHREAAPVYTTKTDKEGKYTLANLPGGEYNLVASRDGFGWRYIYNINSETQPADIKLLPEIEVQGTLDLYTIWGAYQHVIVKGDVIVPEGGILVVDKGAVVRVAGYYGIEVRGEMRTNGDAGNFIAFTGCMNNESLNYWDGMRFNNAKNTEIHHCVLDHSTTGIVFKNAELIKLHNLYLSSNKYIAITLVETDNINFANNICTDNEKALYIQNSSEAVIKNNFFVHHIEAFENEATESVIQNNYFFDNSTGLHLQHRPSATVQHNEFADNEKGIFCAGSDPIIENNTFYKNYMAIHIGTEYNSINSQPEVIFNNIFKNTYSIYLYGGKADQNVYDINCTNNFWGTILVNSIIKTIWDKNDILVPPIYIGEVLFQPILVKKNEIAGMKR